MNLCVYTLSDGDKGTLIAIAHDEEEARVFMNANIPDLYEKIKDGKMTEQFIEESVIYYSYGVK